MSLLQEIQKDQLAARKARAPVAANLLTTLYSEVSMIGKNNGNREVTDAEIVTHVKKMMVANADNIEKLAPWDDRILQYKEENTILSKYIPKQLTEQDLRDIVAKLVETEKATVPVIMGHLKANYGGRYDGKLASEIAKAAQSA